MDGDIQYFKGGFAHRTTNQGSAVFRNIVVDVLRKAGEGSAGSTPERSLDIGHGHTEDVVIETGSAGHRGAGFSRRGSRRIRRKAPAYHDCAQ